MSKEHYIGILGLGEKSTRFYIDKLNSYYNDLYGGYSTCPFKLLNTDFNQINPHLPSDYDTFLPYLKKQLIELNNMGVSQILIPNITLHIAIDKLDLSSELYNKIIHPINETIASLKEQNINQITLIGTKHTSTSKELKAYFLAQNIEVVTMSDIHIKQIDELRLAVYENGYSPELERVLFKITSEHNNPLLCCTELSMLNKGSFELDLVKFQLEQVFMNL